MGEVSSATDHVLDREVAIKLIHPQMSANPNMRRSFAREARAFALLHHPHIVEIYDYGMTESAQIYIAMEFIHGCTLHSLAEETLPLPVIIEIMKQLLSALAHAHAKGLSHLDLKAENVLVTVEQDKIWTKLVDFGIAALPANFDDRDLQAQVPTFGTPAYMAPEQIINNHNLIGPSADIYAAGILLYELLSGTLPFNSEPPTETLKEQISAPIPEIIWQYRPETLPDEIRQQFSDIIQTALAKRPWERFLSADEFLQALQAIPCQQDAALTESLLGRIHLAAPVQPEPTASPTPTQKAIGAKIHEVEAADESGLFWPSAPLSGIIGAIDYSDHGDISESLEAISVSMLPDQAQEMPDYERLDEYARLLSAAQDTPKIGLTIQCLTGSFGIGKTRLCKLFCQQYLTEHFFTILTPALLYHPISQKKYTPDEIAGNVCLSILRQLITCLSENDIQTEDPTAEEILLQILEQASDSPNYMPPPWNEIIDTIIRLLHAVPSPTALIIDDIQRCSIPVYHLLNRIEDTLRTAPLYILLTYDDKELSISPKTAGIAKLPCFSRIFEHTITLGAMSDHQMEAMLSACWQIEPALSERIIHRSFGNPYYATALIQHLGQTARLVKLDDDHFGLEKNDTQSLGVPYIVSQFLHKRLDEILRSMGTVADLYREILIRLAAFGHHMYMQEVEAFWKFDEDQALAIRWKDAVDAWCASGMLICTKSPDGVPGNDSLEFSTPWHADIIQAVLPKTRLRNLKSQVALALIDCYTTPNHEQYYRIALFWRGARDAVSYIQCCQQSADQAFEKGDLAFALDRYDELIEVFDELVSMNSPSPSIIQAIEWPQCIISAAEVTLKLNKFKEFDAHTERLKAWIDKFNESIYLPYFQLLNAKKNLRNENFTRAIELAERSKESFEICKDTRHVDQSLIVLADAHRRMGDITSAVNALNAALQHLQNLENSDELASVRCRLAELELFSGNLTSARELAQDACQHFKDAGLSLEYAYSDLTRQIISFLNTPDVENVAPLKTCLDRLTAIGDLQAVSLAQTFLLIAYALTDDWKSVEKLCNALHADSKTLPPPIITGTTTLMQAMLAMIRDDQFSAVNDLTMALACYGPQNRRARAWCHTLAGIRDMFAKDLAHGTQAFARARNDFMALEDMFGITSVGIAQSALEAFCGDPKTAYSSHLQVLETIQQRDLPLQQALLDRLSDFLAATLSDPENYPSRNSAKSLALPRFFTHTARMMLQKYLHQSPKQPESQSAAPAIPEAEFDAPPYDSSELDI